MINYSMLREGKARFLSGSLADFSRVGTLFYALFFAHLGAVVWLLGVRGLNLEEAIIHLPGFEMAVLMNAACTVLVSHYYGSRSVRTLKILRYGLNLGLPVLNVVCYQLLIYTISFLPPAHPFHVWLYSTVLIWIIFLVLECQYSRLAPSLAEARLQALQNRIHPHFLFNSLNSVLALIRSQPVQAERLLEDMCELFRAVLHDHHATVSLEDELKWCQRYLNIEQMRLGDRLNVVWSRPDTLPAIQIPPLLVQPLIENAIYHGIGPSTTPGTLRIEVRHDEHTLHLRIENPLPPAIAGRSGHRVALDNIQQRLALCFGGEAYLNTFSTPDHFSAELVLPLTQSSHLTL